MRHIVVILNRVPEDTQRWHLQEDVIPLLKQHWDMIIAFPPCTHLAVSGAAWFEQKRKDNTQHDAIEFFMQILNSDCEKIAVENPVNIISGKYIGKHFADLQDKYNFPIKPSQAIQPYEYGHMEQKKTCLWLKGLPLLASTCNVYEDMMKLPRNKRERLHYLPPSAERAKLRSKTYPGIAKAMAEQWAGLNT